MAQARRGRNNIASANPEVSLNSPKPPSLQIPNIISSARPSRRDFVSPNPLCSLPGYIPLARHVIEIYLRSSRCWVPVGGPLDQDYIFFLDRQEGYKFKLYQREVSWLRLHSPHEALHDRSRLPCSWYCFTAQPQNPELSPDHHEVCDPAPHCLGARSWRQHVSHQSCGTTQIRIFGYTDCNCKKEDE